MSSIRFVDIHCVKYLRSFSSNLGYAVAHPRVTSHPGLVVFMMWIGYDLSLMKSYLLAGLVVYGGLGLRSP